MVRGRRLRPRGGARTPGAGRTWPVPGRRLRLAGQAGGGVFLDSGVRGGVSAASRAVGGGARRPGPGGPGWRGPLGPSACPPRRGSAVRLPRTGRRTALSGEDRDGPSPVKGVGSRRGGDCRGPRRGRAESAGPEGLAAPLRPEARRARRKRRVPAGAVGAYSVIAEDRRSGAGCGRGEIWPEKDLKADAGPKQTVPCTTFGDRIYSGSFLTDGCVLSVLLFDFSMS